MIGFSSGENPIGELTAGTGSGSSTFCVWPGFVWGRFKGANQATACSLNAISAVFRPAHVGQQVEASIVHQQM